MSASPSSSPAPDELQVRAEALYESIGGDLCICQRADVWHWCESCQRRIQLIREAFQRASALAVAGSAPLDRIVRRVAELPDRTSPEDWPDAMLVTANELRDILQEELAALAVAGSAPAPPEEDQRSPIPLTVEQMIAVKKWAADDRLWTTQATVQFNLATFARTILALSRPPTGSPRLHDEETNDDLPTRVDGVPGSPHGDLPQRPTGDK